jgi:hypothetical protein
MSKNITRLLFPPEAENKMEQKSVVRTNKMIKMDANSHTRHKVSIPNNTLFPVQCTAFDQGMYQVSQSNSADFGSV